MEINWEAKKLMDRQEIAHYLKVSPKTIYKWVFYRRIPFVKLGKALRFDRAEIDRWVEAQKQAGVPITEEARATA